MVSFASSTAGQTATVILGQLAPSAYGSMVPASEMVAAAFTVQWSARGKGQAGAFHVHALGIQSTSVVYALEKHSMYPVPAVIVSGQATIPYTPGSSPVRYLIVTPHALLPGATLPVTGLPIAEELLGAGALVAVGVLFLILDAAKKSAKTSRERA